MLDSDRVHGGSVPNSEPSTSREKFHTVSLGNGLKCYFSNINEAKSFMAKTNRMLNQQAQLLNKLYIETWTAQRIIYLTHHYMFIRNWNSTYPQQIEKAFNLMLLRSGWQNGNEYTFIYFYNIVELLHEWIDENINLLKKNHKKYEIEAFRLVKEQTDYMKMKLDVWGKAFADREPACFYDKRVKVSEK